MKLQVFILIILAISLQAQVTNSDDCNPGCMICNPQGQEGCHTCWKRLIVPKKTQSNTPVFDCGEPIPSDEHCVLYDLDSIDAEPLCNHCEKGYFLDTKTKKCKLFNYPDCTYGYIVFDVNGICSSCEGGTPGRSSGKCEKWSEPLPKILENCKWGTRSNT